MPLCTLTNVRWCDIHDPHYAAWKDFSNECVRARERERELRLNRLDGDNFHDRDWEEVIPLSGANTKFSLWHSQTHNICFHLALCVCEEEKMKERGRERVIV